MKTISIDIPEECVDELLALLYPLDSEGVDKIYEAVTTALVAAGARG